MENNESMTELTLPTIHAGRHKEWDGYQSMLRRRHAIPHQNFISNRHIAQNTVSTQIAPVCHSMLNVLLFVLDSRYARWGSYWRYNAVINAEGKWPSFVGAALLWSQRPCEAGGIIAMTLAEQLTAEKGNKSCGDDKRSACRKTIHSDSSKEAL